MKQLYEKKTVKSDDIGYMEKLLHQWKTSGTKGKTTLFIGDSFFDNRDYWTDFYERFAGKDAICAGIGGTTTYDWEFFVKSFSKQPAPKNIVVNLGTNNFYDDGDTVEEATEGLQRLFSALHNEFPEARIYYFSIAQRVCKDYRLQISKTNAALKEWCSEREWITFLDIEERLTEDMLRDGLHPKLGAYSLFLDALFEAGGQLEDIRSSKMNFGKDFYWGTATASYQIEGGRCEDGKSDSIWDTFAHKSGAIERGETGDVACDHYHRLDEDLDLLKELGGNAYRFSLSWSRILPNGTGKINEKGTDFYNRLIDGLLERNITPFMTLYHWDLPQVLQNRGGFLNREIADWFAEYAEVVKKLYGDRVKHYFTINEPQTMLGCGYREGVHAPGLALSLRELLLAMHNLLLAHGNTAKVLKTIPGSEVGYASCGMLYAPASDKKEDFEAAYERTFACRQDWRGKDPVGSISSYADPIFFGKYSDWWYEFPEEFRPEVTESDMKLISTPLDFFALNMYDGRFVRRCDDGNIEELPFKAGAQKTQMNWEVTPEVLYWAPLILQKRYKKKIYIGENGIACSDFVFSDGKIHDTYRQEYIKMHLRSLCRAANEKDSKIAGYFHWSFMDNFEWSFGYRPRFGLVHVDFETLKRTPKDSFYYYQDIIKTNGENL